MVYYWLLFDVVLFLRFVFCELFLIGIFVLVDKVIGIVIVDYGSFVFVINDDI